MSKVNVAKIRRLNAQQWALNHMETGDALILDVETTGLGDDDEIIQIAIIDMMGNPLLMSKVRPIVKGVGLSALTHGLTDADLADAPTFGELADQISETLTGKTVLAYNAPFDRRFLSSEFARNGVPDVVATFECVLDQYTAFNRRAKLVEAVTDLGGEPADAHDALGDCLMTLKLIGGMAALDMSKPYAMPDNQGTMTLYLPNDHALKLPGTPHEEAMRIAEKWDDPDAVKPVDVTAFTPVDSEEVAAKKAELDQAIVAYAKKLATIADIQKELAEQEAALKELYMGIVRETGDAKFTDAMSVSSRKTWKCDEPTLIAVARDYAPEVVKEAVDYKALEARIQTATVGPLAGFFVLEEKKFARFNAGALALIAAANAGVDVE